MPNHRLIAATAACLLSAACIRQAPPQATGNGTTPAPVLERLAMSRFNRGQSMTRIATGLLAVAFCLPLQANADMFSSSHSCRKPYKPIYATDTWQVEQFYDEAERYKQCIADFVEEQQEEAQHHTEAAEEAIEEWNSFVRNELIDQ